MQVSCVKGIGFGVTSGIITTLGLMVGVYAGTQTKGAVLAAIVVIAVADAMSDALGVHVSEEAEGKHSQREVWESTFSTLFSKFLIAVSFVVPVLFFPLDTAVLLSVAWGFVLIACFSWFVAKRNNEKPWKTVTEHIVIAVLVIALTFFIGEKIYCFFGVQ